MSLHLPIQGVVDRSELFKYEPLLLKPVIDPNTNIEIQILATQPDGPYGTDPNDPAWFSPSVNPRVAVCHILSSYAAARCSRGGGYF